MDNKHGELAATEAWTARVRKAGTAMTDDTLSIDGLMSEKTVRYVRLSVYRVAARSSALLRRRDPAHHSSACVLNNRDPTDTGYIKRFALNLAAGRNDLSQSDVDIVNC